MKGKFLERGILIAVTVILLVTGQSVAVRAQEATFANGNLGVAIEKNAGEEVDSDYVTKEVVQKSYKDHQTSKWDIYGGTYYYNLLDSEQKYYYNCLYDLAVQVIESTEDLETTQGIEIDTANTTQQQFSAAYNMFRLDNPQFYFFEDTLCREDNVFYMEIREKYQKGEARKAATQKIFSLYDSWIEELALWNSEDGKERKAHDLLCQYAKPLVDDEQTDIDNIDSIALEGTGYQTAYAFAFNLLCNASGIENVFVPLTDGFVAGNIVKINNVWYNVDVFYDDCMSNNSTFNITDAAGEALGLEKLNYFCNGLQYPECNTVYTYPNANCVYAGIDYATVFNPYYYSSNNTDVSLVYRDDAEKLLEHFVNYGMSEMRQGCESFDVVSYRNQYADLRKAFGTDYKSYYTHYINNGCSEGRNGTGCTSLQEAVSIYEGVDYSAVYDYTYYSTVYKDVMNAYSGDDVEILAHFVNCGMTEGRQGCAGFNVQSYRNQYADLRSTFGTDLRAYYTHYVTCGKAEGRVAVGCDTLQNAITTYGGVNYSAVYDYNYYVANNADVARVYGDDDVAILQHFINYGMTEGRQACSEFNVGTYAQKYDDLRAAYGSDNRAYYIHYINYGKTEGRNCN